MNLILLTPEGEVFRGPVEKVTLPGVSGQFTVLPHHAAIISALESGTVSYRTGGEEKTFAVKNGFVEVSRNVVSVCAEQ